MVGVHTPKKDNEPLMQCTHHMCPIRVHWHVKVNYKDYWRVKIAVTNFNYRMNYSLWSLAIQHPNLNNVTQVFSFNYKPLLPYESISKCQHINFKFLLGLNMYLLLANISFFTYSSCQLFHFVFGLCCFVLLLAKFVYI